MKAALFFLRSGALIPLALGFYAAQDARADSTIRYKTTVQISDALPPMVRDAMQPVLKAIPAISLQMKGSRGYSTDGRMVSIIDFQKEELTLVDSAHKKFATIPAADLMTKLAAAMPQIPSGQAQAIGQALASLKVNVDSKATGRTDTIQGVQAEERQVTMTVDMPSLPHAASSGPAMRLVLHIWTARPGEALRVPAVRELTGYTLWQKYFLSPLGGLDKMLGQLPGASNLFSPLMAKLTDNASVMLRTRTELYMPMVAPALAALAPKDGQPAAVIDPNAAILQIDQEVAELSSAPVDAALFEVPKDYTAMPAEELIRGIMASAHKADL